MKLRWVYLILLVLGSVVVSAEIKLDSLSSDVFNLGDNLVVSGSAVSDQSRRAFLTLDLVCGDTSSQMYVKIVDLRKGLESSFSRLVAVPSMQPSSCKITATLKDSEGVIESIETSSFEVTNKLTGAFELVDSVYQLGETLKIRGAVTKLDGTPVNGAAMVFLKKEGNTVMVERADVVNGDIAIDKELNLMPAGPYVVSVTVSDSLGNRHEFSEAFSFDLVGNLNLEVESEKTSYIPGSNLVLRGFVRSSVAQSVLEGVKIIANMGNDEISQELHGDSFDFIYQLPSNIKSGSHDMSVVAKDEDGNYGEQALSFIVSAVPTTLNLKLGEGEFSPGAKVDFDVLMFDQADDPMPGSVVLNVYDHLGQLRAEQNVAVNKKATFVLPEQASPGIWSIKLSGFGLSEEKNLLIKEVKKIEVAVENGKAKVRNVGNVDFKGPVDFVADGVEKFKEIVLGVGNEQEIHLAELFDEGVYNIEVPSTGDLFEGVEIVDDRGVLEKIGLSGITGKTVGNKGSGSWLAVFLVLGLIAGVVIAGSVIIFNDRKKRKESFVQNHDWDHDYSLGQKRAKELKNIEDDKPARKYKYNFGKATDADIADFKQRMVKMVQEEEDNRKKLAARKWQNDVSVNQSSGFKLGGSKPEFEIKREEKKEDDSPFKSMFS